MFSDHLVIKWPAAVQAATTIAAARLASPHCFSVAALSAKWALARSKKVKKDVAKMNKKTPNGGNCFHAVIILTNEPII